MKEIQTFIASRMGALGHYVTTPLLPLRKLISTNSLKSEFGPSRRETIWVSTADVWQGLSIYSPNLCLPWSRYVLSLF